MIGVDILNLKRIETSYNKIASRFLSSREIAQLEKKNSNKSKIEYVGGRYASKEAFIKAYGNSIDFKDVEILNDDMGKPHIYYKGKECGEVSISHDEYVISFVILKGDFDE